MGMPPTVKQLRYLRALADRTGTTFTSPNTAREASQLIRTLEQRVPSADHERDADTQSVNQRRGAHQSTQPERGRVHRLGRRLPLEPHQAPALSLATARRWGYSTRR